MDTPRMSLIKACYKTLLRCAKLYDSNPVLKAMLKGRCTSVYDPYKRQWVSTQYVDRSGLELTNQHAPSQSSAGYLNAFLEGRQYYTPLPQRSLAATVRQAFRQPELAHWDQFPDPHTGPRSTSGAGSSGGFGAASGSAAPAATESDPFDAESADDAVDVAFSAIRYLNQRVAATHLRHKLQALPPPLYEVSEEEEREKEAVREVSRPHPQMQRLAARLALRPQAAREGAKLRRGSLLLAHPLLCRPHHRHALVLIVSHNERGSLGYLLNHPLGCSFEEEVAARGLEDDLPPAAAAAFGATRLHLGGGVLGDCLVMVHTEEQLKGQLTLELGEERKEEPSEQGGDPGQRLTPPPPPPPPTPGTIRRGEGAGAEAVRFAAGTRLFFEPMRGGEAEEAAGLVLRGAARAEDFFFLRGHLWWHPEELQGEVDKGLWTVLASPEAAAVAAEVLGLAGAAGEGEGEGPPAGPGLKRAVWNGALAALGGEFDAFRYAPEDHPRAPSGAGPPLRQD